MRLVSTYKYDKWYVYYVNALFSIFKCSKLQSPMCDSRNRLSDTCPQNYWHWHLTAYLQGSWFKVNCVL